MSAASPPIYVPSLSCRAIQIAAGPRCGCTDCTEAMVLLALPGMHCLPLTPPRAEQGRDDPPCPAGKSRGTATDHIDPRARHLSQGDSEFYGWGSIPVCREPAAPVSSQRGDGCARESWTCQCIRGLQKLPLLPLQLETVLKELISQLDVQASCSSPGLKSIEGHRQGSLPQWGHSRVLGGQGQGGWLVKGTPGVVGGRC